MLDNAMRILISHQEMERLVTQAQDAEHAPTTTAPWPTVNGFSLMPDRGVEYGPHRLESVVAEPGELRSARTVLFTLDARTGRTQQIQHPASSNRLRQPPGDGPVRQQRGRQRFGPADGPGHPPGERRPGPVDRRRRHPHPAAAHRRRHHSRTRRSAPLAMGTTGQKGRPDTGRADTISRPASAPPGGSPIRPKNRATEPPKWPLPALALLCHPTGAIVPFAGF